LNIGGVFDCKEVAKFAEKLPNVVISKDHDYVCSEPGQKLIKEDIEEHKLNRIVVAACSPLMHEPTFRKVIQEAGLNPYVFEMANIREMCSWVHSDHPEAAMEKAKDTIKMAVARALLLEPQPEIKVPVIDRALVIGGGIAGISAALSLANMGFKVYLVERQPTIGGHMAQLDKTFPTMDCSICILAPKMVETSRHPNIELLTCSEVIAVKGYIGNFEVKVRKEPRYVTEECNGCGACVDVCPIYIPNEFDCGLGPRKAIYVPFPQVVPCLYVIDRDHCIECGLCVEECERQGLYAINLEQKPEEITLKVGTIIVAPGYDVYDPSKNNDYGYGIYENVITSLEFERLVIAAGPTRGEVVRRSDHKLPKHVGFITCVGSRDEKIGNPYCCNVGCTNTLKQAFLIKEHHPETEVHIFYMDVRTESEEFYQRLREMGVNFIRGKPSEVEEDPETKNLIIKVEHTTLGRVIEVEVDMLILTVGVRPPRGLTELQSILHIPTDPNGFLLASHPKLKPVETYMDGIYICGAAQAPKDIHTSVSQARGAAATAAGPMALREVTIESITSRVIKELCTGCAICVKYCPFSAIKVEKLRKPAEVIEAACKGCGTCSAECPSNAISMRHFTDEQVLAQVRAALEMNPESKILAFLCNWCSYAGADLAGVSRIKYPASGRVVRVMCSGRVDADFILEAFKKGANQVLVAGCHPGDCHYVSGNLNAEKRIKKLKEKLQNLGIDPDRLRLEWISAAEGDKFARVMREMTEKIPLFQEAALKGSLTSRERLQK
jgi:heterodisulfide reductase subunit A